MSNSIPRRNETAPASPYGSYETYGCRVNQLDVRWLFQRYESGGFLYPEKRDRLLPYFSEIEDNWRRMLRGGELLLWTLTHDAPRTGAWATISSWRSTNSGWHTQHTVSTGGPAGSRAVLLAAQAGRIRDGLDSSHQCWFSPTNRFAQRLFGSMPQALGTAHAASQTHQYLAVPLAGNCDDESVRLVPCRRGHSEALLDLVRRTRGEVYAQSEQVLDGDLELEAVDGLYRQVGLRRTRTVWLAFVPGLEQAAGAVLAYRGPLGLNFSFLENRCDLLLRPGLAESEARAVTNALIHAVSGAYEDFRPGFIPVVTDEQAGTLLLQRGARWLRAYSQSIWLQSGYEAMYRHMEGVYARIDAFSQRRGFGSQNSGEPATLVDIQNTHTQAASLG